MSAIPGLACPCCGGPMRELTREEEVQLLSRSMLAMIWQHSQLAKEATNVSIAVFCGMPGQLGVAFHEDIRRERQALVSRMEIISNRLIQLQSQRASDSPPVSSRDVRKQ